MKKILSVDDDVDILRCYKATLGQRGYEVITTSNPVEVAKILAEQKVDLLMLDVRMPQTDGFMIFKELKKQDRKLPVLFVTAYPKSFTMKSDEMVELWTRDFIDGNTDILYKPFNVEILYEKVESLIGRTDEGET